MNKFKTLIDHCGLSNKGAAMLLGVRYDSVKNWVYGRANVPEGVMDDMQAYAEASDVIFNHSRDD